jgi:hypothetical protein
MIGSDRRSFGLLKKGRIYHRNTESRKGLMLSVSQAVGGQFERKVISVLLCFCGESLLII